MRAEFVDDRSEGWRLAMSGIDHDFYHFPKYVRLAAEQDGGEPLAFIAEEDENRFFLPFVLRPLGMAFDVISPYGYSGPIFRSGVRSGRHR